VQDGTELRNGVIYTVPGTDYTLYRVCNALYYLGVVLCTEVCMVHITCALQYLYLRYCAAERVQGGT